MTLTIPGSGVTSSARPLASETHQAESIRMLCYDAWFKLAFHDSERENLWSGTHLQYFISPWLANALGSGPHLLEGRFSSPVRPRNSELQGHWAPALLVCATCTPVTRPNCRVIRKHPVTLRTSVSLQTWLPKHWPDKALPSSSLFPFEMDFSQSGVIFQ